MVVDSKGSEREEYGAETPPYLRSIAFLDGEFMPAAQARVSIFDHSFLYGDGAFESMVCRNGRVFELAAHLDRLWASCAYLQIAIPASRAEIVDVIDEVISRNGPNGDVRIVVSRGEGYPMSDPRKAQRPIVAVSMQVKEPAEYPAAAGLRIAIVSTRRLPPVSLDPRVKANNYLNHIVAKLEALSAGADDALMLDTQGRVAELPGANIFALHGQRLATPRVVNVLDGVTRRAILELAASGASPAIARVEEADMYPYELYTADEVFVTGSGVGLAFVGAIDGRQIGSGECGPAALALGKAYQRLIDGAN